MLDLSTMQLRELVEQALVAIEQLEFGQANKLLSEAQRMIQEEFIEDGPIICW